MLIMIIIVGWGYAQRGCVQTIIGNFFDPKRLELETAQ